MSILGNRVVRREDPKFLTTGGTYLDDLRHPLLEGALHVTYVRSTMAHARLGPIETEEAKAAPGVVAVFTAADLDLAPIVPTPPIINQSMVRPWLAGDVVRFVGEPIAVVVSEQPDQGADAAELIWGDLDPLPVVVDPEEAERSEAILFPDAGTNVALDLQFGSTDDLFDGCEVLLRQRVVNQRVAACPLEVRAAASAWSEGRLHVWISTQHAQAVRDALQSTYSLDDGVVRVVAPDVGGGFGAKIDPYPEELLLPWIARRVGRPVRWVETRSENMVAMGHGRGQVQDLEIGGSRDGRIEAYRLTVLQDAGAYPAVGAALPWLTRVMVSGVYDIPKVEFNSRAVVTNTTATVSYRGAGRPEASAAIERAVDLFAAEIGIDPAEVRRRNLIRPEAFPYTNAVGTVYDTGEYEAALDLVLAGAGYDDLRAEQRRRRESGDRLQLGVGLSVYVEVTAGPSAGGEHARVDMRPDGTAVVYTGTSPHGQGHVTAWSMIAGEELGIDPERIQVVYGDTDLVPKGEGTMGSRSAQLGGSAVLSAARQVVDKAREVAAELLEADPVDVVLDKAAGRFHVVGTPAVARTWVDVAGAAEGDALSIETEFRAEQPSFPFGAHVAVVEVDVETGSVHLRRLVAVDDAGRILNPLLAEGQRHGGLAQGAAQALLEEVRYDESGNPITSNFADYAVIGPRELPSFELLAMETPTPLNPLGAKGIGESGTIGSTPAVQGAVVDALSHLGVRHLDMPATSERVWRAIQEATAGGSGR